MIYIAHRGLSGKFPENTVLAFEEAYKNGARYIEFDVCLSKDKVPVIIHDDTLDRTTNSQGKVKDTMYLKISELEAGLWKNKNFMNCKIPTLEEILKWAKPKKNLRLNIEIKSSAYSKKMNELNIEVQTLNLINKFKLTSRVFVSSFNSKILTRLRKINPSLQISILPENDIILNGKIFNLIHKLKPFSINLAYECFTKEFQFNLNKKELDNLQNLLKLDKTEKIFVYTINSLKKKTYLEKFSVSGIFTDYFNRFSVEKTL
jgi:glycerophosphoryl diester phosphodiesterase